MTVQTINPATEELLGEYRLDSANEIAATIDRAARAFADWRKVSLETRLGCVASLEQVISGGRVALAELMTREMGKVLKESLSEVDKCIASCKTLRENYPRWRSELVLSLDGGFTVTREPMGVLLGIMPWNFPLWQVLRFAVPALLSGNAILLKHAPSTWGSAEFIGELFAQAFPEGLYANIKIDVPVIESILADSRVRGVSLTGSRPAGQSVAKIAGAHLKKAVLELGGSDAYVILDDADLELAVRVCVTSRLLNAGQSCVSAKRFIVTRKNVVAFTEQMRVMLAQKTYGDPMDSSSDLGPLARKDLRDQLHQQVLQSQAKGARVLLGGKVPEQKGFFYPPTLISDVRPGQSAFDDELFGPVAAVIEAENEIQALKLANQSIYGLGAAVFSRDVARAKALAIEEIEAGMIFVNDFVRSDALVPFGGVKDSGLGRELGRDGSFEFTYVKTIFAKA